MFISFSIYTDVGTFSDDYGFYRKQEIPVPTLTFAIAPEQRYKGDFENKKIESTPKGQFYSFPLLNPLVGDFGGVLIISLFPSWIKDEKLKISILGFKE